MQEAMSIKVLIKQNLFKAVATKAGGFCCIRGLPSLGGESI